MKPDHYGQHDVAPMAKHLAWANEARVPFLKREFFGNPVWAWILLIPPALMAIALLFIFP